MSIEEKALDTLANAVEKLATDVKEIKADAPKKSHKKQSAPAVVPGRTTVKLDDQVLTFRFEVWSDMKLGKVIAAEIADNESLCAELYASNPNLFIKI